MFISTEPFHLSSELPVNSLYQGSYFLRFTPSLLCQYSFLNNALYQISILTCSVLYHLKIILLCQVSLELTVSFHNKDSLKGLLTVFIPFFVILPLPLFLSNFISITAAIHNPQVSVDYSNKHIISCSCYMSTTGGLLLWLFSLYLILGPILKEKLFWKCCLPSRKKKVRTDETTSWPSSFYLKLFNL